MIEISDEVKNALLEQLALSPGGVWGRFRIIPVDKAKAKELKRLRKKAIKDANHCGVQANFGFYNLRVLERIRSGIRQEYKWNNTKWLYNIFRQLYLRQHPICEYCNTAPSTIIHHTVTRKTHLIDCLVFKASCRACEDKQHGRVRWIKCVSVPSVEQEAASSLKA